MWSSFLSPKSIVLSVEIPSYRVVTVSELDQMIYARLVELGAAKRSSVGHNQYEITDVSVARSDNILPQALNQLGKIGWSLTAVNKMECFIFERRKKRTPVEYKVMTTAALDEIAIENLQLAGHATLTTGEGDNKNLEVHSAEQAKIQNVLPKVLATVGKDGWELAGINGPQLYIFKRPIK